MSKFNSTTKSAPVSNLHGAKAFSLDAKTELATLVASSFVTDQFYRSATDTVQRVRELINLTGPEYAAKAAIYGRTIFGMRSISHVIAGELAEHGKGQVKIRTVFDKVVQRPDDMAEIAAYHRSTYGGTRLPNSMVKGFKRAFNKFNGHQLAKYKLASKDFSLVDLVNIVKPKPTEQNAEALKLLVEDKLVQTGTWEDKLSAAGSDTSAKQEAWSELINTGTIGYLALIRNLRNIVATVDAPTLKTALSIVADEARIKKAKIFPFQLYTAYTQVTDNNVRKALSKAIDLSCANCPELANSLVVIDTSASMRNSLTGGTNSPIVTAALFGAALANRSGADLMIFGDYAAYLTGYDPNGSVVTTLESIVNKVGSVGHGTAIKSIFDTANKPYDRIIVISDLQCNIGETTGGVNEYKRKHDCNPFIYSFDLCGYGTTQFKGKFATVSGFTDKVFDLISRAEIDPKVLVNEIEALEL